VRMTTSRLLAAAAAAAGTLLLCAVAEARNVQLVAAGGGQVRAFVVGIDDYSSRSIPTLKGAVADAVDIETALRSAGVTDLTVLKTPNDATRQRFVAAMQRLIDVSSAGDLVIISFAGHGSQEPELVKGSETDGMDEIFLLSGFANSGPGTAERIIDDEMNHWLSQLAKKKVDVLYIADTCHGGGMLRSADFRAGELSYRFVNISMDPQADKLTPISTVSDAELSPEDLPNVTFLAAVNKQSQAPEVRIAGAPTLRGALSYAVARSIDEGQDGAVTRQQLFGFARQITYQYSQTRQTIATEPASDAAKLGKIVFRLKVSGETGGASADDPVRLRISGGDANSSSGIGSGQFPIRIVANGEDADLVWDAAKGDVLNGYGDIIAKAVGAGDITAIAEALGATVAITKMSEVGPQKMRLLPDDSLHHQGETVRFHVEGVSGKYLILVNLASNGQVQLLYPRLKDDTALISDEDFDLPLRVSEPFGSDHLIAIVSDNRLDRTEAAISALDTEKAAGKLVNILRSAQLSDRSVRFGMAASFTAR
jgi:Caspase domain/Domain of unknown function (DUF4384)